MAPMPSTNESPHEPNRMLRLPLSGVARLALGLLFLAAVAGLFWWRRDSLAAIGDAFRAVRWEWVVVAIALNLLSVVARAVAWTTVIHSAMEEPHPGVPLVFSAFSVGLFANAVLPGRIGELARVAVLTRKLRLDGRANGTWAVLVGTVFAHRLFDLIPTIGLILYVLATAKIPHWAIASLAVVGGVGFGLFAFALMSAQHHHESLLEGLGPLRRLIEMSRHGLGVLHRPGPAAVAGLLPCGGLVCPVFALFLALRAV